MNVGFTGTQHGMSEDQKTAFRKYMLGASPVVGTFHHGDCVGADEEAHNICRDFHLGYKRNIYIIGHPPKDDKKRAFCECDYLEPEKDYLVRNHDIVNASDLMIAAPRGPEIVRSGTWATIRYARSKNVPTIILPRHKGGFIA